MKQIKNFSKYFIDEYGRLFNKDGFQYKTQVNKDGYAYVSLRRDDRKRNTQKIHRLVAAAYLETVDGKEHVNHKDGDKLNNHVSNLEWCTMKENIQHYFETKFKCSIPDDVILFIRKNIETVGMGKLAAKFNMTETKICAIANGIIGHRVHKEFIRAKQSFPPKKIAQIGSNEEIIKYHNSITSAAKECKIRVGRVQEILKGERRSCHGYRFKYA